MLPAVLIVVLVLLVLAAVLTPWRRREDDPNLAEDQRIRAAATVVLELEAARDAKYREIRDAELDRETGHLAGADFAAVDATLRSEAVEILKRLDQAQGRLTKLQTPTEPATPDSAAARTPSARDVEAQMRHATVLGDTAEVDAAAQRPSRQ